MLTGKYQWGLGLYIGIPTVVVLVAVCLVVAIAARRLYRREGDEEFAVIGWGALAGGLVVILLAAVFWYPFSPARQFHAWNQVQGTVASTSNRFLEGGQTMSQRIVVRFAEDPANGLYGCDDSRCTSLKAGDRVRLLCKREWQFRGQSGWECKWDGEVPA